MSKLDFIALCKSYTVQDKILCIYKTPYLTNANVAISVKLKLCVFHKINIKIIFTLKQNSLYSKDLFLRLSAFFNW